MMVPNPGVILQLLLREDLHQTDQTLNSEAFSLSTAEGNKNIWDSWVRRGTQKTHSPNERYQISIMLPDSVVSTVLFR